MNRQIKLVVIGTSAGGIDALKHIFCSLCEGFNIPIAAVIHISQETGNGLTELLNRYSSLPVSYPEDKEKIEKGRIYIAPPDYHLLIEKGCSFSLNVDDKVNFCRPSIDVLFESASYILMQNIIAVLLTGSNRDGASGIAEIKRNGGLAVIEDPDSAFSPFMPKAGIEACIPDFKGSLDRIADYINNIYHEQIRITNETE